MEETNKLILPWLPTRMSFTGTRRGMSIPQKQTFGLIVDLTKPSAFSHGNCAGADSEAHLEVLERSPETKVWVFPSNCSSTAMEIPLRCSFVAAPKSPKERDRDIVKSGGCLVAAPLTTEIVRSGTWTTVRIARKLRKVVLIVWCDGSILVESINGNPEFRWKP